MPLVNFSNLDFDQIKDSLKDYLRSNSDFTDYDFEGSNLSVIIDTLAYNTYLNSYNANMVSNEVFIDSATLRENVVSLAKNVGYIPRSATAARSSVSFFVDTGKYTTNPSYLTLKKGLFSLTRQYGVQSYSFNILDNITTPVVNGIAFFDNVLAYEGTYLTEGFTVDSFNPNQRFILGNGDVDTTTLRVVVKPSEDSQIQRVYQQTQSLFDVDSKSPIYFVQEIEDGKYELIFGDGIFGIKPESGNYIEVSYIVTSAGTAANNVKQFVFSGRIIDQRLGTPANEGISALTTLQPSFGGTFIESVDSIKRYSTKQYAAQGRAVTAADYEACVTKVYADAESVSAFGGEEITPPEYGKVFIAIKPIEGAYLSNYIKDNILTDLENYSVAGIEPVIIDLSFLYVEFATAVYFNTNIALSAADIINKVEQSILDYSNISDLNRFGARFKYSNFQGIIDNTDDAITSNITTITLRRDLRVLLNVLAEYEICFGNAFLIDPTKFACRENGYTYNIRSSGFKISGVPDTVYIGDRPMGSITTVDKKGSLFFFKLDADLQPVIVRENVGRVNYDKGEIILFPVVITETEYNNPFPMIKILVIPASNDIVGLQDLYLQLDVNSSTVTAIPDNIASGNDISGTNFITTSSYPDNQLTYQRVIS